MGLLGIKEQRLGLIRRQGARQAFIVQRLRVTRSKPAAVASLTTVSRIGRQKQGEASQEATLLPLMVGPGAASARPVAMTTAKAAVCTARRAA